MEKTVSELKADAYDLIAQMENARAKLVEINQEINQKIGTAVNQPILPKE